MVVVLAFAIGLVACSDSGPSDSGSGSGSKSSSDTTKVYTEDDTDVTVANGHTFAVELPITTGTGYEWTAVTVPDLQQMETETVQQANRPGAQALQRITFRAQAASGTATTTLTLNYARSFEQGVPPAKTATFTVKITD